MISTPVERPKPASLHHQSVAVERLRYGGHVKRFCKEVLVLCFHEVLSCGVYNAWIRHSTVSQLCASEACGSEAICLHGVYQVTANRAECLNV